MTKRQLIIISTVILLPMILGIILLIQRNSLGQEGMNMGVGPKIGLVRIVDVIYSSDRYTKLLREFREDKNIAGVLLRIESPGGAAAPSQEIFEEVFKFRSADKPIVVSMGNVAASGGYYIAAGANRIFANPATITGSIGVIFRLARYYKLADKFGVEFESIKSGRYKDAGNPFKAMTSEERAEFERITNDTYDQFVTDVAKARDMPTDTILALAQGRIYTGREAQKVGLVDTLGNYEDAVDYLKAWCGIKGKPDIVDKKERIPLWKELFSQELFKHVPDISQAIVPSGCYCLFEGVTFIDK